MALPYYRLLFVGPPGVGKGTYAGRAAAALHCSAVSSGDLLRRHVTAGTEIGKQVKHQIESGIFVPDSLITRVMMDCMAGDGTTAERAHGYILDGFPRNLTQAETLWGSGDIAIDHVIHLTQPINVICAKLSSRRTCSECGFVYNCARIDEGGIRMEPLMPTVEGVCDKCGSSKPLITRKDDEVSIVKKRLEDYDAIAQPMISFYRDKGILLDFPVLGSTREYLPKLLSIIRELYRK